MPTRTDGRRWLVPGGRTTPERRPLLAREYSAPAVLERTEHAVRDVYESLPLPHPRNRPLLRRLGTSVRGIIERQEERAEAGAWRLAMRAAWWWLTRCWRRR